MKASTLVKKARRRAGFSQRRLAATAGVPQSTIGRIESGAMDPRARTLQKILKACAMDLSAEPRPGDGIDETQILERLALTPRERIERATVAARNVARLRGKVKPKQ